jgi:hypothetical protein
MTAEQLHKMQQEAKERHNKTFAQIIDENFEFYDGKLRPKTNYKKTQKNILPDLMIPQTSLPCMPIEKKEEIPIIKKSDVMSTSIFDKPYVPKPVQEKRKRTYTHFTAIAPDPPKEKQPRPPAIYDNKKSHYGIYDELKESWGK